MKTRTILATWMMVSSMCASLQASTAGQPSALSRIEPQLETDQGVALVRAATNPFAGRYCGSIGLASGSITISDSGHVSGFFSYYGGRSGNETYKWQGSITAEGVMCVKVFYTYSEFGGTEKGHYSLTFTCALDESGNLVGASDVGALVLYSCP